MLHRLIKRVGWNLMSSVCEAQPVAFFFRERKVGALLHIKRRFCAVQQKESRHVCKILFKEVKILPNKQIALSGL